MTLRRCTFADITPHAPVAHADGLILSRAMATAWFLNARSTGFVGTKQDAFRLTIGALFVFAERREVGYGGEILRDVIAAAGNRDIEVTCPELRRRWFGKFGFIAARPGIGGTWLMVKPKKPE
jgi:hypothetical protein